MTKHEKRLQKARNNPKSVSYKDFVSILETEGYTIRQGKGSHRVAYKQLSGDEILVVFAVPHGKKKNVNPQAVKDLLVQLDEANELEEGEDDE